MTNSVYQSLISKKSRAQKSLAVLIDPDKVSMDGVDKICRRAIDARVDYLLVGGSLVISNQLDEVIHQVKKNCNIPVILFPGSPSQISGLADALLYLSLISGRNADLLIGQHVISAPFVKQSRLEIISTGYMVIDGGAPTTVSYISNALPIPSDKNEIAMCTAMAGEMLGMKVIYLDAGSGAKKPVTENMIAMVAENISVPLIAGGGISDPEKAYLNCKAGADLVVIGNAIEKDPSLIAEMSSAVHMVSIRKPDAHRSDKKNVPASGKYIYFAEQKVSIKAYFNCEMQKKPANIIADVATEATSMRRFLPVQPCAVFFVSPVSRQGTTLIPPQP